MNRNGKVLIKGLATGLVVTNGMLAVPPVFVEARQHVLSADVERSEPMHTPGNGNVVVTALTNTSTTNSYWFGANFLVQETGTWRVMYAVAEPLPEAVTRPTGQVIEFVRATTDDQPAGLSKLA